MSIFSALVVFAMIWAMLFLIFLQVGQNTQGDNGTRVPGTHLSSPENFRMRPRILWTTGIAIALWVPLIWLITSGLITIEGMRAITGRTRVD